MHARCFLVLQEWQSATSVAKAFALGKLESEAIYNLRLRISPAVTQYLANAVKIRGMTRLVTHEVLARDVLNPSWTSGLAAMEPWREELRNKEGDRLATCLLSKLICLPWGSGFRKPHVWGYTLFFFLRGDFQRAVQHLSPYI